MDTFALNDYILVNEVIIMRYKPFYPGDKVITIVEYDGVPSGTTGKVTSRWGGTAYVVRLLDGTFRWLSDRSLGSNDPNHAYRLEEGEIGVVVSDAYQNFAKEGEKYKVYKVAYDVDYYGVFIGDVLHWFGGFQLAKYE